MPTAHELTARLADLLRREHAALADFLVALADFDARRVWLELGHPNLFSFLHRELGLSKGAAHYRKVAAELVRRFPELVEPLREGKLCITSVVELAKVLTPENREDVLPRFFHRSKREAAEVVAALRPCEAPPSRTLVTAARANSPAAPAGGAVAGRRDAPVAAALALSPAPASVENASQVVQLANHLDANFGALGLVSLSQPHEGFAPDGQRIAATERPHVDAPAAPPPSAPRERDLAEPLTADLRRLHVTVSRSFLDKLEAARSALSHARPGATTEELLEAGLDLVLAQHAKRKGLVARPRDAQKRTEDGGSREQSEMPSRTTPAEASRSAVPADADASPTPAYVPAHVRRAVWRRDGGRCRWPLHGGGVCGSTLRLELDHVVPRARGGPSTLANLRVLCAFHNQHAARLAFGDRWIERCERGANGRGTSAASG